MKLTSHLPTTVLALCSITISTQAAITTYIETDSMGVLQPATSGGNTGVAPVYTGAGTIQPNIGFTQVPIASSSFITVEFITGFTGAGSLKGLSMGTDGSFADLNFEIIAADPSMASSASIDIYTRTNRSDNHFFNYIFNDLVNVSGINFSLSVDEPLAAETNSGDFNNAPWGLASRPRYKSRAGDLY